MTMEAPDIKACLLIARQPPSRIAERLGVTKAVVSNVIHGRKTSRRVALEIARVIGRPASAIWPGKYQPKVKRAVARKPVKRASRAARG